MQKNQHLISLILHKEPSKLDNSSWYMYFIRGALRWLRCYIYRISRTI